MRHELQAALSRPRTTTTRSIAHRAVKERARMSRSLTAPQRGLPAEDFVDRFTRSAARSAETEASRANDDYPRSATFGSFADEEFSDWLAMDRTMRFFPFELTGGDRLTRFFGESQRFAAGRRGHEGSNGKHRQDYGNCITEFTHREVPFFCASLKQLADPKDDGA